MAEVSVLVRQCDFATRINRDGDEGAVEVVSTIYGKAFRLLILGKRSLGEVE